MRSSYLPYTIVSCSSEDPQFPVSSIQNSTIRSSGWQTEQNPSYPVSFVVDLGTKCDLETLQFVSHQSKIARKVVLQFSDTNGNWKLLGSFQFSDNSHTRYSARELKSANLQRVSARFVRVYIEGCHSNANNPGNQVGIVSFKILGRERTSGHQPPLVRPPTATLKSGDARPPTATVQERVDERIAALEKRKKDAVATEDFETAAKVKRELDSLKQKRDALIDLEKAKQAAVAREDFDTAAEIKSQIEQLLSGNTPVPSPVRKSPVRPDPEEIPIRARDPDEVLNELPNEMEAFGRTAPRPIQKTSPPFKKAETLKRRVEPDLPEDVDEWSVPVVPSHGGADLSEDRPIRPSATAFDSDDEEGEVEGSPFNFQINDLAGTLTAHPDEEVPESDEVPDDLNPTDRQEAASLITLAGEDAVQRFFSKSWVLRLQGIKAIAQSISGMASGYAAAFQTFCYICRHRVQDNQKQIVIAVLNAVRDIAETHQIEPPELTKGTNQFLSKAVAKIGGSQQAVTDAVGDFLVWMSQRRALDVVLPIVIAPVKNSAQWKAAQSKIDTLHNIVLLHGIDTEPGLGIGDVMKFVVPFLESPKVEVRQAAIELIVTLETMVGAAINKHLDGLPTRQKREIEKAIETHSKSAE